MRRCEPDKSSLPHVGVVVNVVGGGDGDGPFALSGVAPATWRAFTRAAQRTANPLVAKLLQGAKEMASR